MTKPNFLLSRREMLRRGCRTLSVAASAAAVGPLGQMSAWAQSGSDYKALVCIFLFGGNDANNMIVPLSASGYADYQRVRQNIAIPAAQLTPVANSRGESYGMHPSLAALAPLYASREMALLFNVGTLVRPVTRAEYRNGTYPVPRNLFSHSDQQQQWQNAAPLGGVSTGWCGRVADLVQVLNAPSTFPTSVGVAGNALQLLGQSTMPTTVQDGSFGLLGDDSAATVARDAAYREILTMSSGAALVQAASQVTGDALRVAALVDQAANSANPLNTQFPETGLGQQLLQVAKVIQVRQALGMRRQIFFCSLGGFDTHSGQLGSHAGLLTQLAQAIAAFQNATGELGVRGQVTTFTESEFSRTFQPNGTAGTDHAWGGHCLVVGGAVKGGETYGAFPTLALGGPDDSGSRGNWVPTAALDQYGATMASWFGVQPGDLTQVFPNLANFPAMTLGFL